MLDYGVNWESKNIEATEIIFHGPGDYELKSSNLVVKVTTENGEELIPLTKLNIVYECDRILFMDDDIELPELEVKRIWALFKKHETVSSMKYYFENYTFLADWVNGKIDTDELASKMDEIEDYELHTVISIDFSMYKMAEGILNGDKKFIEHPDWDDIFCIDNGYISTQDAENSGYLEDDYPELMFNSAVDLNMDDLRTSLDTCKRMLSDAYNITKTQRGFIND